MEIVAYGLTDVGQDRDHNEDFVFVDPALGLYIVCDGMGGHAAGEVASQMCAETIRDRVAEQRAMIDAAARGEAPLDGPTNLIRLAIEEACARIFAEGQKRRESRGMGTTCTALLICGGKGVVGHVGDSRLYLLREQQVTQLTNDHTMVAEALRRGMITEEEAETSEYGHVITRAVGPQASVIVDTLVLDIVAGDTIMLCSDGLAQYVRHPSDLSGMMGANDGASIPHRLIDYANQAGGSDNITAILVRSVYPAKTEREKQRTNEVKKDIDALRHVEVLREMTMAEVVQLSQVFQEMHFAPGALMVREQEASERFFVIVEGEAEVYRGDRRIASLKAGTHFGEMALLNRRPRSATVRAATPIRALASDREPLYEFLLQEPRIATKSRASPPSSSGRSPRS